EGNGNGRNQNGDAINDNIHGDVRNVIKNNDRRGYTYKDFLACNHKEYDGKGGAVVYTHWIEKIESVQDMSSCGDNQTSREVAVGMVAATKPKTIQKAVQIAGTLINEALRNGSIQKNYEKRGNGGEPSKDRNVRDDNKRTRTGNAFATTTNPVRRENMGAVPKVVPRNVNPINARNPTSRAFYECSSTNPVKATCPSYEIEIASGQLVEIDKVIKGCKLEIEGHVFDINLIPFRSGSFNMIIGMDWLSNHKAKIICHQKVVRIPLLNGKVLRVIGERPEEKARQLMSVKAKEKKQEEIEAVRDFPEVFSDDLSGFPPN
ncbi:putative reverse transcriptase domain-containing protein, partial [Tanacetum coccineum]